MKVEKHLGATEEMAKRTNIAVAGNPPMEPTTVPYSKLPGEELIA